MDKEVFAYGSDDPVVEGGSNEEVSAATEAVSPRRGWGRPLLIGALVVALALAGAFAALWAQSRTTGAQEVDTYLSAEVPLVEDRAREVVDLLMNYDATNIDARADQIRAIATGSFLQEYEELIDQLGAVLEEASASSRGQVISGPEIFFRSPSEAIALVRVSQTTQSTGNPTGRTFLYVLRVGMVQTEARGWVASDMDILSEEET